MGIEGGKKGKTGAYATGADILEELATEHELPARVLDWRPALQAKSTYTDALQDHINPETGRVHTSYLADRGHHGPPRLLRSEPAEYSRFVSEEGRRIREAFVAEEGKTLVALDYSQIELRILAHIAGIRHSEAGLYRRPRHSRDDRLRDVRCPLEDMTPDIRRQRQSDQLRSDLRHLGLWSGAQSADPARRSAEASSTAISNASRASATYMDDTKAFAKEHGYVQTLVRPQNPHSRDSRPKARRAGFAARAAINAPIQGTAADVIRRAMVRMPDAIEGLPAKMLLQVHDELLFEVDNSAVDDLISVAKEVMENANNPLVKLDVKLTVDAGQGSNWAQAH